MARRRILLIGDQGQVGWELRRSLATLGEVIAVGRQTTPYSIDLTRPGAIAPLPYPRPFRAKGSTEEITTKEFP